MVVINVATAELQKLQSPRITGMCVWFSSPPSDTNQDPTAS